MALPDGSRGNVVELRVHGVSGTPPEELLDRQLVRQVAGDKTAGFYRPRLREEWRDRPTNDPGTDSEPYSTAREPIPPPLLEGYSWGGLTSGSPSRALWLVLLPFTLINVAPRMRPVPGDHPHDDSAGGLAGVVPEPADGRQPHRHHRPRRHRRRGGRAGLAVLRDLREPALAALGDVLEASSGWRVVWGACLPLAVLAVLALLSWRNSVQYDLIRPTGMQDSDKVSGRDWVVDRAPAG